MGIPQWIFDTATGFFKNVFGIVFDGIKEIFTDPVGFITKILQKVLNNGIFSKIKDLVSNPVDFIMKIFKENGTDFIKETAKSLLSVGGVIPGVS